MRTITKPARNISESAYPALWKNLAFGWSPSMYNSGVRLRSPISTAPPITLVSGVKRQAEPYPVKFSNLFNGTSDAGSTGATLPLTAYTTMSVVFWMYWDSFADDDDLAWESSSNFNSNAGAILCNPSDSGISLFAFAIRNSAANDNNYFSISRPSAAVWHCYVVTFNTASYVGGNSTATGAITAVYVDGVAQTNLNSVGQTGSAPSGFGAYTWYWMSRAATSLFGDGRMGDFYIYPGRLLTIDDAKAFYRGASPFISKLSAPITIPIISSTSGAVNITPNPIVTNVSVVTPGKTLAEILTPIVTNVSIVTPTTQLTRNITPSPVVITASIIAPSVSLSKELTPIAVNASIVAPSKLLNNTPTPIPVSVSVVDPSKSLNITLDPILVNVSVVAPSTVIGGVIELSTVTVNVSVVQPSLSLNITPSPIQALVRVISPDVSGIGGVGRIVSRRRGIPHREGAPIQLVPRTGNRVVTATPSFSLSTSFSISSDKLLIYSSSFLLSTRSNFSAIGILVSIHSASFDLSIPGFSISFDVGRLPLTWDRDRFADEDEALIKALTS